MKHVEMNDETRKILMESAAWGRAGLAPTFLSEDGEEEEAPAEEAPAEESEEESSDDDSGEAEAVTEEDVSRSEVLAVLLSEMTDEELLDHIASVMDVVDSASEVLEEEEEESAEVA